MFDHVKTNTCMRCLGRYKTAPCLQTDVLEMKDNVRPVVPTKEILSHWQRILGQDSPGRPLLHLPTDHNRHHSTMSRRHNHQWQGNHQWNNQWGSGHRQSAILHRCYRLNGVFLKLLSLLMNLMMIKKINSLSSKNHWNTFASHY